MEEETENGGSIRSPRVLAGLEENKEEQQHLPNLLSFVELTKKIADRLEAIADELEKNKDEALYNRRQFETEVYILSKQLQMIQLQSEIVFARATSIEQKIKEQEEMENARKEDEQKKREEERARIFY